MCRLVINLPLSHISLWEEKNKKHWLIRKQSQSKNIEIWIHAKYSSQKHYYFFSLYFLNIL